MAGPYYTAKHKWTVAETDEVRVVCLTLGEGESIPWHYHTLVKDTTFCLSGKISVELMDPVEVVHLEPGQHIEIPRGRKHRVAGEGERVFLLVQGTGKYDFVPV